jgi:hypothetical protein
VRGDHKGNKPSPARRKTKRNIIELWNHAVLDIKEKVFDYVSGA